MKVKLKLEQPAIMCSGRERINCFYRGKLLGKENNLTSISFKSYGQEVEVTFVNDKCLTPGWEDLKIIK
jgi:hypothetical protein